MAKKAEDKTGLNLSDDLMDPRATLRYARERVKRLDPSVALFIWGPPGIGKSTMVREVTEELGIALLDVRVAQLDAVDFRGIPAANRDKGYSEWLPFAGVLPMVEVHGEKGILFLDELNLGDLGVQKAAYQLILDRRVGNYKLPDGWRIVAAGNRPEDAPGMIQKMSPPLKNRFMHCKVNAPVTEDARLDLFAWFYEHNVHPSAIAYLKANPGAIHDMTNAHTDMAWASQRSWVMLSKALNSLGAVDNKGDLVADHAELVAIAKDCVGIGRAMEYAAFTKVYANLPDARMILMKGLKGVNLPKPDEIDIIYALCTSAVMHFRELYNEPKAVKHFFELMEALPGEPAMFTAKEVMQFKNVMAGIVNTPEFKLFAKNNVDLVPMSSK